MYTTNKVQLEYWPSSPISSLPFSPFASVITPVDSAAVKVKLSRIIVQSQYEA